jgi:hypothetical protein
MSAARSRGYHPATPWAVRDRSNQARAAPRDDVVFRSTTRPDGSATRHYEVPGVTAFLNEPGFRAWLSDALPSGREVDLVSVLVIQDVLDHHVSILTCCLERRRGSATGPFRGQPAR